MPHLNILYRSIFCFVLLAVLSPATIAAQEAHTVSVADTLANDTLQNTPIQSETSSLSLPYVVPAAFGFYDMWHLHEGLNAQFGLNLTAGFGKGSPKGVGFGQQLSLAYVQPVGKRWHLTAGLTAYHMDWGRWHQSALALNAQLSYRLSERWLLYAYAVKQITPRRRYAECPGYGFVLSPYAMFPQGDRIGFGADWKLGDNCSIQINVEASKDTHPMENIWWTHPHSGFAPMMPYGW